jgi:hypothetical protein
MVCTMPRRPSAIAPSVALLAMAFAMLCAVACESPTLPLPPPEAPTQTPGVDADHITLTAGCGGAQGGADIIIINQTVQVTMPNNVGDVSLASGCGAWEADNVLAHTGDMLAISQEWEGQSSTATIYMVR